jgi:hypothetical protein
MALCKHFEAAQERAEIRCREKNKSYYKEGYGLSRHNWVELLPNFWTDFGLI